MPVVTGFTEISIAGENGLYWDLPLHLRTARGQSGSDRTNPDGRPFRQRASGQPDHRDTSRRSGFLSGASAYTLGTSRFTFRDILLTLEQNYYLVVREPGYKDLRYEMNMNDFVRTAPAREPIISPE